MQHKSISVPMHTPFTAVLTATRPHGHTSIYKKALESHSGDSAALQLITKIYRDCATEFRVCLDAIASRNTGGDA